MQRTGLGRFTRPHLKNVGDVLAAVRREGDAVLDRPVDRIDAVDLTQGNDLAQVMAGVHTSLLDSLDISLRMTRQAQELLEQSLFPGIVPLFKERERGKAKKKEERTARKKTQKSLQIKGIEENPQRKFNTFEPPSSRDVHNAADTSIYML